MSESKKQETSPYVGTRIEGAVEQIGEDFYIDEKSITLFTGESIRVDAPIFVTRSSAFPHLSVGDRLSFILKDRCPAYNDETTLKYFAIYAELIREDTPNYGGIEITFPETNIDNPTVPIQWRLQLSAITSMRENPAAHWALIIIAQEETQEHCAYSMIHGIQAILSGCGYLTFHTHGTHQLVAYLVHACDPRLQKELQLRASHQQSWRVWENNAANSNDPFCVNTSHRIITYTHLTVEIPDGIFAKPLPKWLRAWLGYFGVYRQEDECVGRTQILLSFFLGIPAFILWEGLKRCYLFLLGLIGHFLIGGGDPRPLLRETFSKHLSAYMSGFWCTWQYEKLGYWGQRWWLHPLSCTAFAAFAWMIPSFPAHITLSLSATCLLIAFGIKAYLVLIHRQKHIPEAKKLVASQEVSKRVVGALEQYGKTSPVIPVPRKAVLYWDGIKRLVCRPYAQK